MNLILDIGNTAAKLSIVDGGSIAWSSAMPFLTREYLGAIASKYAPDAAIVSSTKGDAADVGRMLEGAVGRVVVMTPETPVPIGVNYDSRSTLGTDRIALAVGAVTKYGLNDALIVDIGTAITFDILSSGTFVGGNISLGLEMRAKALHDYTFALPKVDLNGARCSEKIEFGTSTEKALTEGILQGVAMEIEGYISALRKSNGNLQVVICGGGAKCFENRIKNAIFANCELSVFGLNAILEYNER